LIETDTLPKKNCSSRSHHNSKNPNFHFFFLQSRIKPPKIQKNIWTWRTWDFHEHRQHIKQNSNPSNTQTKPNLNLNNTYRTKIRITTTQNRTLLAQTKVYQTVPFTRHTIKNEPQHLKTSQQQPDSSLKPATQTKPNSRKEERRGKKR